MSLDIYFYVDNKCPHCGLPIGDEECVFDKNITHNLAGMAREAGFYTELWHPEEKGTNAKQLGEAIEEGIKAMEADPERFKKFSATNGWGTYDQFIPWLREVVSACKDYPEARLKSSV